MTKHTSRKETTTAITIVYIRGISAVTQKLKSPLQSCSRSPSLTVGSVNGRQVSPADPSGCTTNHSPASGFRSDSVAGNPSLTLSHVYEPPLTAAIIGLVCSSLEKLLPRLTPAKRRRGLKHLGGGGGSPAWRCEVFLAVCALTLSTSDSLQSARCSVKKCPRGISHTRCRGGDPLQRQQPNSFRRTPPGQTEGGGG